jgi:predicted GNAT family N-acyltransferase
MPIRPFLQPGVFDPEVVEAMGIAFERACRQLRLAPTHDAVTETVAKVIIDLAKRGEGDPERLYRAALARFGETS